MGYKCNFIDNEIYGAEDVSEAFTKIVSGGVRAVADGANVIDTLNELTSDIVTEGTRSYAELGVTIADGLIVISEGVGFFECGVTVTVDSDGIILNKGERTTGYVSILYEPDLNKVLPQITDSEPTGDVLLLARFDGDTITDLRSYAHSKLSINSGNVYHDFSIGISAFHNFGIQNAENTATYKMPQTDFKYLILRSAYCELKELYPKDRVVDISEGGTQIFTLNKDSVRNELWVDRDGDMLTFTAYFNYDKAYPQTYELTLV